MYFLCYYVKCYKLILDSVDSDFTEIEQNYGDHKKHYSAKAGGREWNNVAFKRGGEHNYAILHICMFKIKPIHLLFLYAVRWHCYTSWDWITIHTYLPIDFTNEWNKNWRMKINDKTKVVVHFRKISTIIPNCNISS